MLTRSSLRTDSSDTNNQEMSNNQNKEDEVHLDTPPNSVDLYRLPSSSPSTTSVDSSDGDVDSKTGLPLVKMVTFQNSSEENHSHTGELDFLENSSSVDIEQGLKQVWYDDDELVVTDADTDDYSGSPSQSSDCVQEDLILNAKSRLFYPKITSANDNDIEISLENIVAQNDLEICSGYTIPSNHTILQDTDTINRVVNRQCNGKDFKYPQAFEMSVFENDARGTEGSSDECQGIAEKPLGVKFLLRKKLLERSTNYSDESDRVEDLEQNSNGTSFQLPYNMAGFQIETTSSRHGSPGIITTNSTSSKHTSPMKELIVDFGCSMSLPGNVLDSSVTDYENTPPKTQGSLTEEACSALMSCSRSLTELQNDVGESTIESNPPDIVVPEYMERMEVQYGDMSIVASSSNGTPTVTCKGQPLIDRIVQTRQKKDTIITLSDGRIGANRFVLAAVSPFLADILTEQDRNLKQKATIILPDVRKQTMELLLTLCYTGSVIYAKEDEENLFDTMLMLQVGIQFDVTIFKLPPRPKPPQTPIIVATTSDTCQPVNEIEEPIQSSRAAASSSVVKDQPKLKKGRVSATIEEIEAMSFCCGCDKQWKTLGRATKCLSSHNLNRCWICLGIFDRRDIRNHYLTNHCDASSLGEARSSFVACRWCDRKINIRGGMAHFSLHVLVHFPPHTIVSKGEKRPREGEDGIDEEKETEYVEEVKGASGQTLFLPYKTLKGVDTKEMDHRAQSSILSPLEYPAGAVSPQPSTSTSIQGKLRINIAKFPRLEVQLYRMPSEIEDKIFRRIPKLSEKACVDVSGPLIAAARLQELDVSTTKLFSAVPVSPMLSHLHNAKPPLPEIMIEESSAVSSSSTSAFEKPFTAQSTIQGDPNSAPLHSALRRNDTNQRSRRCTRRLTEFDY